ncbi:M14 family metallopeptidase [Marinicella sp. S1101]|uniref:M14 family metallopeptidase n=1 Tax=Marinicella marina TaxID=2996016 RepID=UPI002260E04D|nr:M14 family metallopeptidase [Marinicella marina]MCX7552510.1 M14 family metallopeptidase [Marinicella marina]MDJ1139386.1 M14 family metallopeptidase [Marinicella marina]
MIKFISGLAVKTLFFTVLLFSHTSQAAIKMTPTPLEGLDYNKALLTGDYDDSIPTPESILGFAVGQRTATPEQIAEAVNQWHKASPKMQLIEYARSHENRPLYYALISTPNNLARVDEVKADLAKLADPKGLSATDADEIIARLPAVSWMAYSIHGNESSGSDAALAAIYHLIASEADDIKELLQQSIVIIDPSMNPDGRARFTKGLQQARGIAPNVDNQSLLHSGTWPYGRTNHYLFDLNRDFILGVHPETIGRVKAINQWYPQLMIDGHEMGSQSTYLFSPSREPINKNMSAATKKWGNIFADDQAASFDDENWPYFTGEWFENLYPGYSSYAEFRGSVHILYEQARIAEDGVRQANGRIVTYQESVHHQLVSTITNLKTLAKHSKEMYRDFLKDRRKSISSDSVYANTTFALPPNKNSQRMQGFIDLMELQGFELFTLSKETTFSDASNQLGDKVKAKLPKGSLIIRNRQPEARLLAAILEFDVKLDDKVLVEERQNVLRDGGSIMYDTTAWNLTMMHGLEAYTINDFVDTNIAPYQAPEQPVALINKPNAIAYVIDGADDASVGAAAQIMEQGVKVRILDKATALDGHQFSRGSVVINRYDNEFFKGDLTSIIEATATKMAVSAVAINSGLGKGDLPDIGGSHFRLLEKPEIAILSHGSVNFYDFGTIWHSIDSNLGIRHSHLDFNTFNFNDLRRYNTLVIPDMFYGKLDKNKVAALKTWVEAGGTLIAIDGSISSITDVAAKLSGVRQIGDTFKDITKYDQALQREWLAQQDEYPEVKKAWSNEVTDEINYPWHTKDKPVAESLLKKQDDWLREFAPSGAIVAARTDEKHWLTFGAPPVLPVLVSNNPVLMSDGSADAVVRMGVYEKMSQSDWNKVKASFKDQPVIRKAGWSTLPDEYRLKLRMSGLLWPEASQRIANSAYLTREAKGNGQIILFASQPVFRGSTKSTNRLLLNALVYGSGLGTNVTIKN